MTCCFILTSKRIAKIFTSQKMIFYLNALIYHGQKRHRYYVVADRVAVYAGSFLKFCELILCDTRYFFNHIFF